MTHSRHTHTHTSDHSPDNGITEVYSSDNELPLDRDLALEKINQLEREQRRLRVALEDSRQESGLKEKQFSAAKKQFELSLGKAQAKIKELSSERDKLLSENSPLSPQDQEVALLNNKIDKLISEQVALRRQFNARLEELNNLNEGLLQQQQSLRDEGLQKQLDQLSAESSALQTEILRLQKLSEEYNNLLIGKEEELAAIADKHDALILSLNNDEEVKNSKRSPVGPSVADLIAEVKYEELNQEIDKQKSTLQVLQTEIDKKRAEMESYANTKKSATTDEPGQNVSDDSSLAEPESATEPLQVLSSSDEAKLNELDLVFSEAAEEHNLICQAIEKAEQELVVCLNDITSADKIHTEISQANEQLQKQHQDLLERRQQMLQQIKALEEQQIGGERGDNIRSNQHKGDLEYFQAEIRKLKIEVDAHKEASDKLREATQKIDILKKENEKSRSKETVLTAQVAILSQQQEHARQVEEEALETIEKLEAEKIQLQNQLKQFEQSTAAQQQQVAQLTQKLQDAKFQLQQQSQAARTLAFENKATIDRQNIEIERFNKDHERLLEQNKELKRCLNQQHQAAEAKNHKAKKIKPEAQPLAARPGSDVNQPEISRLTPRLSSTLSALTTPLAGTTQNEAQVEQRGASSAPANYYSGFLERKNFQNIKSLLTEKNYTLTKIKKESDPQKSFAEVKKGDQKFTLYDQSIVTMANSKEQVCIDILEAFAAVYPRDDPPSKRILPVIHVVDDKQKAKWLNILKQLYGPQSGLRHPVDNYLLNNMVKVKGENGLKRPHSLFEQRRQFVAKEAAAAEEKAKRYRRAEREETISDSSIRYTDRALFRGLQR